MSYDVALSFSMDEVDLVKDVYFYLKAEGYTVFFAPECQEALSGKNQREVFYNIFGLSSNYVVLFVSESYLRKKVTMEEAHIAFSKLGKTGRVLPIYTDHAELPIELLNPSEFNYFKESRAAFIASHISGKIALNKHKKGSPSVEQKEGSMNNINNQATNQVFINKINI
ncbi:MAG: hypothetical protein BGO41_09820 [Clostridiales bacterium 38-18]|nr:MAG: hypothetical protein BGO41_09820 [Clostridiales bacterium 38-18]